MKQFITTLIILLSINYIAQGQNVSVNMNLMVLNGFYPEEIWNVQITNGGSASQNIYMVGEIKDASSNILVTLKSPKLNLKPGINVFVPANVTTAQVNYSDNDIRKSVLEFMTLPAGGYIFCINVYDYSTGNKIGNDCQEGSIKILSKPVLVYPPDRRKIYEAYPLFTWIPPMPYNAENSIKFEMKLVEMQKGQTSYEAMESNPFIFYKQNHSSQSLQYTVNDAALKHGQQYAWKVIAYKSGYNIGESETWAFTYDSLQNTKSTASKGSYAVLRSNSDAHQYKFYDGHIRFIYNNRAKEESWLNYKLYSENDNKYIKRVPKIRVYPGINKIDLETDNVLKLKLDKGHYIVEVYDQKNKKQQFRFCKE